MTEEFLSVRQIASEMGLAPSTIGNYVSGHYEPRLKVAKRVVVDNIRVEFRITREDFETWKTAYASKKPFGAKLHKKRKV